MRCKAQLAQNKQSSSRQRQHGSSLLEVLIALLIMATGLLGLSYFQMISLKNINNSQSRTLATAYAYDMAERMRSNHVAVVAGYYDAIAADQSDPNCTSCSAEQMAQLDGFKWNQLIKKPVKDGGLPNGAGTVSKNGTVYDIKIVWNEQQRDSSGGNVSAVDFTLSVQL